MMNLRFTDVLTHLASNYDAFATENDGSCVFCDLHCFNCRVRLRFSVTVIPQQRLRYLQKMQIILFCFYEVNGESVDGPVVSGLPAGDYTITVFDGPTCQADSNVVISEPDAVDS